MIDHTRILVTADTNPYHNLALEDLLLHALPEKQALLYLWQNRHTVVIGAGQNAFAECHTKKLAEEEGTLARRSSGGGAVYHDMGNLNFSFIVPREDYDVERQLKVVLRAVRALGIDAEASGRNDLTVDGRKFSGNAFRLLKDSALHHGTLLVNVDMGLLPRYLNVSEDKLKAKGVKSVPSRVVNLTEYADFEMDDMRKAMIDAFIAEYGQARVEDADALVFEGLDEYIEKYAGWDWVMGVSPRGELTVRERFSWGMLELDVSLSGGRIGEIQVYTDAMDETLHIRLAEALKGCRWDGVALAARAEALQLPDVAEWFHTLG